MGMRLPKANKEKMKYSLQGEEVPVYETDEGGNIKYYESGGIRIPLETGEYKIGYSEPVEFSASISYGSGEAEATEYGFAPTDYDSVIIAVKDEFPIAVGTLIWTNNEVEYDEQGNVREQSANLRVVGVKPSLSLVRYLLKVVQNG